MKTRLTPPLEPVEAAAFYSCMLDDVLERSAHFAREYALEAVLAGTPEQELGALAARAPVPFRVVAQRGRDLSQRMSAAAAEAAATGAERILLRGSDSPMLDRGRVGQALAALDGGADLVLCPDLDGGYSLVGLRRPVAGLFDHEMSTASVLEDTLARAQAQGLRSELLEACFDIDHIGDLVELEHGRTRGLASLCRRTLEYADHHALWSRAR